MAFPPVPVQGQQGQHLDLGAAQVHPQTELRQPVEEPRVGRREGVVPTRRVEALEREGPRAQ